MFLCRFWKFWSIACIYLTKFNLTSHLQTIEFGLFLVEVMPSFATCRLHRGRWEFLYHENMLEKSIQAACFVLGTAMGTNTLRSYSSLLYWCVLEISRYLFRRQPALLSWPLFCVSKWIRDHLRNKNSSSSLHSVPFFFISSCISPVFQLHLHHVINSSIYSGSTWTSVLGRLQFTQLCPPWWRLPVHEMPACSHRRRTPNIDRCLERDTVDRIGSQWNCIVEQNPKW